MRLKTFTTGGEMPLRIAIDLNRAAMAMFSRYEQNAAIRDALKAGGQLWTVVFLPQRFSDYVRRIGYDETAKWEATKIALFKRGTIQGPQPTPFVFVGIMRETAMSGARVEAAATASRQVITIRIPFGHPVQSKAAAVFRTVPPWEVLRIAEEVRLVLARAIAGMQQANLVAGQAGPRARAAAAGRVSVGANVARPSVAAAIRARGAA